MTIARALTGLALLTLFTGCSTPATTNASAGTDAAIQVIGSAKLMLAGGTPAGTATIHSVGDRVSLVVSAQNIAPGPHGFHLHQIGSCEAPAFTSAGGHLNPLNKTHGTLSDGGSHVGDLPNLQIAADGTGTLTAPVQGSASQVSAWIYDQDGTAVVIHVDADDYRTDPTGNAGGRLACGVFLSGE